MLLPCDVPAQAAAVDLINPEAKVPDDDGCVELDLSKMTPDAMVALAKFIRAQGVVIGAPAAPSPDADSVRLDTDSDDESYDESDSD